MRATLSLPRRATYSDYLMAEQDSPTRHEFIDGVIVATAGGSEVAEPYDNILDAEGRSLLR